MSKKIISAKIPEELYNQIIESNYNTNTDCIIAALNLLFFNTHQEDEPVLNGNTELIQVLQEQITIKDSQIEKLQITQQTLATKLESQPLMVESPGQTKPWWQFWK